MHGTKKVIEKTNFNAFFTELAPMPIQCNSCYVCVCDSVFHFVQLSPLGVVQCLNNMRKCKQ